MAIRECQWCGDSFTGRVDAKYCHGSHRAAAARARRQTRTEAQPARSVRMETGARMLGLELYPHQHDLGVMLDRGVETNIIQWVRRAGKTTAIWCWLVGYCEEQPDTLVMTTAQSGIKARDRFMSMVRLMERHSPEDAGGPHIYKGAGHEAFEWSNGSRLWVTPPTESSARGDAADVVFGDEQGELAPDASLEFKRGVEPLLDTRPQGQIVLAGTPGKVRAGWYWDALQLAREDAAGVVGSIYAAEEDDDLDDEAVWLRVHPGIGTLTTLEKMRARHASIRRSKDPTAWDREYMGIWPGSSDSRAIGEAAWEAGRLDEFPPRPARVGLAFDTAPDSSSAALVAAWRDDAGTAYIEVIAHGAPREIGAEAVDVSRRRKVPIGGDTIGANAYVWDGIARARPKPKTMPLKLSDMTTAAAGLATELRDGTARHAGQPSLDDAVEVAVWRDLGDSGRLFGRRASAGDVTPIVAGSAALLVYDRTPAVATVNRIVTRRSA